MFIRRDKPPPSSPCMASKQIQITMRDRKGRKHDSQVFPRLSEKNDPQPPIP